jgi:hypothetical protein
LVFAFAKSRQGRATTPIELKLAAGARRKVVHAALRSRGQAVRSVPRCCAATHKKHQESVEELFTNLVRKWVKRNLKAQGKQDFSVSQKCKNEGKMIFRCPKKNSVSQKLDTKSTVGSHGSHTQSSKNQSRLNVTPHV